MRAPLFFSLMAKYFNFLRRTILRLETTKQNLKKYGLHHASDIDFPVNIVSSPKISSPH
jgi:hypothetical protein